MAFPPDASVIKTGTFLYDNAVTCDIRIVHSRVLYGTGDANDPDDVREDREGDFYYVQYGSPTKRNDYPSASLGYDSLSAAIEAAEHAVSGVKWLD